MTRYLAWTAIALYVGLTIYLTIRGARKSGTLSSYAVGNRDIPPWMVGLSLSAQLTSVATFVINPGLVYAYGVAGMLGLGGAAAAGIVLGLIFFSSRFRRMGSQVQALTIPQWIGARYDAPWLRMLFGILSMALISFVVLIVVAISLVMAKLLGIGTTWLVLGIIVFVFSYVMIGGATTSAYTNAIQASIMLLVALVLIGSGITHFWQDGGMLTKLAAIDPNLASITNPKSAYFRNIFEVFVCNFLVGIALVCQPHILGKALYLKEDKQVRSYLTVAIFAGLIFVAVMLVGLYARVDPQLQGLRYDHVVPTYIAAHFSPILQVLIGIGVLCAGLSTLEGILLALSAIVSIDLYLPFAERRAKKASAKSGAPVDEDSAALAQEALQKALQQRALQVGRASLVVIAAICAWLCFRQLANPTGGSVAIFAQFGVYLLFTGSFFPLVCGMFLPRVARRWVGAAVVVALATYLGISFGKPFAMANNPAVLATCGMFAGGIFVLIGLATSKDPGPAEEAEQHAA